MFLSLLEKWNFMIFMETREFVLKKFVYVMLLFSSKFGV